MASTKQSKVSFTQRVEHIGRTIGRAIAASSLPEIMLYATLTMSRYLQNSDFSYPSEMVLPIVLFGVLATASYYGYYALLRNKLAAHSAALLLSYGLYGISYTYPRLHKLAEALIPDSVTPFTHALLVSICLAAIFGLVGFAVKLASQVPKVQALPVLKFLVFVVCFIFAAQVGKVGMRLWEIRKDLSYTQPTSALQTAAHSTASSKPNVYYLLFDRYASATTLKNIYNYDNTPFLNSLQQQGFTIRDNAFANYPFTMQSVSSTLSADYHTKVGKQFLNDAKGYQTGFPYRTMLNNSPVTQAFKANGYQYNQVSSWWDFTRLNPSADTNPAKSFRLRAFGQNFWLSDLQRDVVNKSVLSPFLLKGMTVGHTAVVHYQLDRNPAQNFYAEMAAVKAIAKNSKTQSKPQFTFAHVLSPHDPYVFDAAGNPTTYDGNRTDNDLDETTKYTNQLSYVNGEFEKLVQSIRSNDPTAVIIMQADEGPYPKQFRGTLSPHHYYDPYNLPLAQQRQKFGILAAYYLPGTTDPQPIDASVNAFRVVLNNYLGYQLPLLPDCQFTVGDKYNLYTYHLVTGQLKGQTANPAACPAYK